MDLTSVARTVLAAEVKTKAVVAGLIGLAILSGVGAIPRVGVLRSLTVGWKSYLRNGNPKSLRLGEKELLNKTLNSLKKGGCIVVTGEKGNGKSCLIDTALFRLFGTMEISVSSCFKVYSKQHRLLFVHCRRTLAPMKMPS
jgi:hypothetical protein